MAGNIFICSDGHKLAYNLWLPSPNIEIKAFLQILHGMAEYSDRYARFAEYLNKLGIKAIRGPRKIAKEVSEKIK